MQVRYRMPRTGKEGRACLYNHDNVGHGYMKTVKFWSHDSSSFVGNSIKMERVCASVPFL